jgi:surface protein
LNDIDTREITDMSNLFSYLDPYNIDIRFWDVSNVTNMSSMFYGCYNFNGNLSTWDVSNVKNMAYMFDGCKKFSGQGLENWKLGSVIYTNFMF